MTLGIFFTTLTKFEIEVVNPIGDVFDPEFHEAVQTVDDPEGASGNVLKVLQKGYTLNGRLLRPAMVVIAS
jgi:molecular chaperone GrpE